MTHFQRFGCEARIACNGKMAMLEAGDFMLEVILLDYHLPDMNGPTRGAARPAKAPTAHPMQLVTLDTDAAMRAAPAASPTSACCS